jgi:hypothetical protein
MRWLPAAAYTLFSRGRFVLLDSIYSRSVEAVPCTIVSAAAETPQSAVRTAELFRGGSVMVMLDEEDA